MNEAALINFKSGNSTKVNVTSVANLINKVAEAINDNTEYLEFGGAIISVKSIEFITKAEK
jgi:hypothetical protein